MTTLLGLCIAMPGARADDSAQAKGAEEAAPAATAEQADEGPGWSFWIQADEQYRLRKVVGSDADPGSVLDPAADGETDHDLRFYLAGGFRDPSDRFGADVAMALWLDADGDVPEGTPSGLGQVTDYRNPWWDVYTLQADYRSRGVLKLARVGRQAAGHGQPLTFDGASLEAKLPLVEVFAFGGRSVHFFETRQDLWEDWVASGGLAMRPMRDLRIEADYRFSLEDVETTQDSSEPKEAIRQHSYGLTVWYRNGEWLQIKAHLRGLDDAVSHAGGLFRLTLPGADLGADLGVAAQLVTLRQLSEREDPFYSLLGESLPHLRWHLDLWKRIPASFGDFGVHLGWDGRQVLQEEEDTFNRSLNRLYLQAEAIDVFTDGLFARLSVEGHFTHVDSNLTGDLDLAVGGAAGYQGAMLGAELGTYYQRVKYDYYQDLRIINDVRTTYAALSIKPLDWLRLRARYEWERSDRDVHTALLSVAQSW